MQSVSEQTCFLSPSYFELLTLISLPDHPAIEMLFKPLFLHLLQAVEEET